MKKLIQTAFTKLKDYFTANLGCKIFFFGLVATTICLLLNFILRVEFFQILIVLSLAVAGIGTLWDTMVKRYDFLQKMRAIQYDHLKEIYEKQAAGEAVEMTATFTDEEKRYLRRRKWGFVFQIMFKVGLLIALFSLLSGAYLG